MRLIAGVFWALPPGARESLRSGRGLCGAMSSWPSIDTTPASAQAPPSSRNEKTRLAATAIAAQAGRLEPEAAPQDRTDEAEHRQPSRHEMRLVEE